MIGPQRSQPQYHSIKYLKQKIEEEQYLLPEFQRNFTWSLEQTIDLLDSICRDIFIGAIIVSKPKFDLTCREIDRRPRKGNGKQGQLRHIHYRVRDFEERDIYVVLDGQQRLTSLFRALTGLDELFFVFKVREHLPSAEMGVDRIDNIIDGFSLKRHDTQFSISVAAIANAPRHSQKLTQEVYNPSLEYYPWIKDDLSARNQYLDLVVELSACFQAILEDKTLLSVFLLEMDLDKFCLFFERSNSKGIALNFVDIITAKVYKGFNLRSKKAEFKEREGGVSLEKNNQILEAFVRYISFLTTGRLDKKTILEKLDDSHFTKYWDEVCNLFLKSRSFIKSQRLLFDYHRLPYHTMYIPAMHFIKCLPRGNSSRASLVQQQFFKLWFWSSLLNGRYAGGIAGSTNDSIVEDCEMLQQVAKLGSVRRDFLRKLNHNIEKQDLMESTSIKGAVFIGVMSIINSVSPLKELKNEADLTFGKGINVHHIYPKHFIRKRFSPDSTEVSYSDSILNKMFVEQGINIKFGNKPPSVYLSENSCLHSSLTSHMVPNPERLINGSYDDCFLEFLNNRAKLISDLLEQQFGALRESITSGIQDL